MNPYKLKTLGQWPMIQHLVTREKYMFSEIVSEWGNWNKAFGAAPFLQLISPRDSTQPPTTRVPTCQPTDGGFWAVPGWSLTVWLGPNEINVSVLLYWAVFIKLICVSVHYVWWYKDEQLISFTPTTPLTMGVNYKGHEGLRISISWNMYVLHNSSVWTLLCLTFVKWLILQRWTQNESCETLFFSTNSIKCIYGVN